MRMRELDPLLLDDVRRDEPGAYDRLLDAVLPVVLQWCARLGGPRVDAEDAAHDVCVVLLRRVGAIRDAQRFPAWLFGTTRRVLAQHRRRAWVRRWVPGLLIEAVDPDADPFRAAELSEQARAVQATLDDLSEREREILVLFDVEDRSESEVAEILDIPLGTARSRVRAARERFRRSAARHRLAAPLVAIPREDRS